MSNFYLSKTSKRHMEGVDPRLVEIANLAIQITRIDFGIPKDGGVRTEKEQQEIFYRGASSCDGVKKKSRHQPDIKDGLGKALDFYAYEDGKASYRAFPMAMVGAAMLAAACILGHKIKWGGFWPGKRQDMPHIQLID